MDQLIQSLSAVVGTDAVLSHPEELLVYECDGLPHHKHRPRAVVFPESTEAVSEVMRVLAQYKVPFTPRGAGTGLSGGALALNQGVVVELARMRKVLKIDEQNQLAVVQTGIVNSHVSHAVAHLGLHYVPDPSSQPTCTIGGNIAENAGGIHCLKYGTTTDHILGLKVVLAGGEIVDLGGGGREQPGFDLPGVFVGSEGTFGIAVEAALRLVPIPPAVRTLLAEFAEVSDASHAVSAIIAAGVMPAALEMMDREIIRAVEASVFAAGLPPDAGAALLIELDGVESGLDDEAERVTAICLQYGARDCRSARDENERKKLWAARKGAFGAIGRISPDSMIQDAVVPRSRLPEIMEGAYQIADKYQLRLANVFHAGDGNLHPLICFDSRSADQVRRVKEAGRELMETCVRAGGSITGEHGVGLDKRDLLPLIFSDADMEAMLRVRAAFDPLGLCNPGKIIPTPRGCGEGRSAATVKPPGNGRLQLSDLPPPVETSLPIVRTTNPSALMIASIVGGDNVTSASEFGLDRSFLVTPGSVEEICEVMKLSSSSGWAMLPAGNATWLNVGDQLQDVDLIISTRRLNSILEHEPADLIAITQAGVTLDSFNTHLGRNGQWLPVDPPDDGRASIGGVVATGLGGVQQPAYGPPRRHVIGMKVVLADGGLIKAGGRVVKNVAGYDLCKLFTGSYGTLGIIAEVNFKLRPVPVQTSTLLAVADLQTLWTAARYLMAAHLFPTAVELVSSGLCEQIGLATSNKHGLLIKFSGYPGAVSSQVNQAATLLSTHGCQVDQLTDESVWRSLQEIPLRLQHQLVWRVGLLPSKVGEFLSQMERHAGERHSEFFWHAGIADGRVRVVDSTREDENITATRTQAFREAATRLGGVVTIEHAAATLKQRVSSWPLNGSSGKLMDSIKRKFDPGNLLSPGRFALQSSQN